MEKKTIACISILAIVILSGVVIVTLFGGAIFPGENSDVTLLFVQSAASGTFEQKDGQQVLTLLGVSPATVYFSDRPYRITGVENTELFVSMWSDGADSFASNPPNAVLEIRDDSNGESEIFILELMNPMYDHEAETLQYYVKILAENDEVFSNYKDSQDISDMPTTFKHPVLFIDGCTWHALDGLWCT